MTRAGTIPRVQRPGTGTLEFLFRNLGVSKRRVMEELALAAVNVEPRLAVAVQRWLDLTPWQRRFGDARRSR